MKAASRFLFSAAQVLFFILSSLCASAAVSLPYRAQVTQVLDGKTIRVSTGHRIELQGIKIRPGKESEAKQALNELVFHKEVVLNYDPKEPDRYGRAYAYVFLDDNNSLVNRLLIEKGVAEVGRIPENVYYRKKLRGEPEEPPLPEPEEEFPRELNKRMTFQFFYIWRSIAAAIILAIMMRIWLRNK